MSTKSVLLLAGSLLTEGALSVVVVPASKPGQNSVFPQGDPASVPGHFPKVAHSSTSKTTPEPRSAQQPGLSGGAVQPAQPTVDMGGKTLSSIEANHQSSTSSETVGAADAGFENQQSQTPTASRIRADQKGVTSLKPSSSPEDSNLQMPAAFAEVLASPSESLEETALYRIQENFLQEVSNTIPEPGDARGRANWRAAQIRSDALYRAKFGTRAFLQKQMENFRSEGGWVDPLPDTP